MAIESHFYDTLPGKGVNEIEWAESARSRGPLYGVASASELLCTAHPSTPYAVNLSPAPSGFWGHGVWDTSDAIETVVCPAPANGVRRFDLIASHRDWTPTGGGPTSFIPITGSSARAIPSGRANSPGEVDDQPLHLVEWVGGQTQPQSITDLRLIGGTEAVDNLVLSYMAYPGASVRVGSTLRSYQAIGNGQWGWRGGVQPYGAIQVGNYQIDGTTWVEDVGDRKRVTLDHEVRRTGENTNIGTGFAPFGAIIQSVARGNSQPKYLPVAISGGGATAIPATVFINPADGTLQICGFEPFTWAKGARFSLNCSYFI